MAGNNSIQILRGSQTYDPSTSDQVLLDGQPFYSKKDGKLRIGKQDKKIKELDDVAALNLDREIGSVDQKSFTYTGEELYDGENVQLKTGEIISGATATGYQSAAFGGLKYDVASYNYVQIGEKYYDIVSLDPVKIQYKKGDIVSSDDSGNITIDGVSYTVSANQATQEVTFLNNNDGQTITSTVKANRTPTSAEGHQSFAAGGSSHAYGDWSVALGKDVKTYQRASIAFGGGSSAGMPYEKYLEVNNLTDTQENRESYEKTYSFAFAAGELSRANGRSSFALNNATVNGDYSVGVGIQDTVDAKYCFSSGYKNYISKDHNVCSTIGANLKTGVDHQTIVGKFNAIDSNSIFIVGTGYSESDRRNGFTIDFSGNSKLLGNQELGGALYAKGWITTDSSITANNGLSAKGNINLNGTLNHYGGSATFNNGFTSGSSATVKGYLTVENATITNGISSVGTNNFNGSIKQWNGSVDLNGNVTMNGTLKTNSNVTMDGILTTNSTVTMNNSVTANGTLTTKGITNLCDNSIFIDSANTTVNNSLIANGGISLQLDSSIQRQINISAVSSDNIVVNEIVRYQNSSILEGYKNIINSSSMKVIDTSRSYGSKYYYYCSLGKDGLRVNSTADLGETLIQKITVTEVNGGNTTQVEKSDLHFYIEE